MTDNIAPQAESASVQKTYQQHVIMLDESSMRFRVLGPLVTEWFASYSEATAKIDAVVKKHEAQQRRRISITVLTERGMETVITGIHAGNGTVLGADGDFYPNVEWVKNDLRQIMVLNNHINRLRCKLKQFTMSRYSLQMGSSHSEKVDELIVLIEKMTAAASREP